MNQRLSDYDITKRYEATVVESQRITPQDSEVEVRHIILKVSDPGFQFVEGQSIGVLAPGCPDFGERHHLRLYSIASGREGERGDPRQFAITVRRCFYVDEFTGEERPGVASNFLCDCRPRDTISITGPYGSTFTLPEDENFNILMIGIGTGIAPFRAFVKRIYKEKGRWKGKVRLFYGGKRGLELLYMNDLKNDFINYYDEETFKAFEALSLRPALDEPIALDHVLEAHADEVWQMVQDPLTNIYLAGLESARAHFDKAMSRVAGSEELWQRKKADLASQARWFELLY